MTQPLPSSVAKVRSSWPSFNQSEIDAVTEVLSSNKVNYWTGGEAREFEREFARYFDAKYSIAMANGTVVIEGALQALGVGRGDEVIVTPRTFIGSISAIVQVGATPIFADVDLDSQNITAQSVETVITKKTKAIICVHLAGWPCDMAAILDLAASKNLAVVEDCAQAHGAMYRGKSVGSLGDIGCWSFCQDKIMTTGGEGGMITTDSQDYWAKLWSHKDHGKSWDAVYESKDAASGVFKWVHESFGTNWRMTEMQAAIGRVQLNYMNDWSNTRRQNADNIWSRANEISGVRVPSLPNDIVHAAYKCYVFVEPSRLKQNWSRDRIIAKMRELNVPCMMGSCSEVYLEKAFDKGDFRPKKRLPNAQQLGETSLMFTVHPTMQDWEIDEIIESLTTVMNQATK